MSSWRRIRDGVYVREVAGELERHECDAGACRATLVRVRGVDVCAVSNQRRGCAPVHGAVDAGEQLAPTRKRAHGADPMERGINDVRRVVEALYVRLFGEKLVRARETELLAALASAGLRHQVVSDDDLEPATLDVLALTQHVDCDAEALACAVLDYRRNGGLVHAGVQLFPNSDAIAGAMPSIRSLAEYGVDVSLVKEGVSAIARCIDAFAASRSALASAHVSLRPLPLRRSRRIVKGADQG